ncbi:MAG TPA: MBL fold metallo-hydrolase [Candidatus Faecousia gallistercoris]|nr:MBL fold metallo-hydrolase [Candidatus Faecousia gallistercoris]
MGDWFTTESLDGDTYVLSEDRHWEHTHCYLLNGSARSLLVDTGLGIGDLSGLVRGLTDRPVVAVATHAHWDHIGGHSGFPCFYVHEAEQKWLDGAFPLPLAQVRAMVADCDSLPRDFRPETYTIFQGTPDRVLQDGDEIDLGGRRLQVLHTPGHSPGHMCFWEAERGYLFTGDLVYMGTLFASYPSTDPAAYLTSLKRVAALPVKRVFPGHHGLQMQPGILRVMAEAFQALQDAGALHHGSGTFSYGDWSVQL